RLRPRAGGHVELRQSAAPVGAWLPVGDRRRGAREAAVAAARAVPAVVYVLPLGLDARRLHGLPDRADPDGPAAAGGHGRRPVPDPLRAVLRAGAADGG